MRPSSACSALLLITTLVIALSTIFAQAATCSQQQYKYVLVMEASWTFFDHSNHTAYNTLHAALQRDINTKMQQTSCIESIRRRDPRKTLVVVFTLPLAATVDLDILESEGWLPISRSWFEVHGGTHFVVEIVADAITVPYHGSDVPVYCRKPKPYNPANVSVVFVQHGVTRAVDTYFERWASFSDQENMLVLAPEFSTDVFPGSGMYNRGNILHEVNGAVNPESDWSFSLIDKMFAQAKLKYAFSTDSYRMYGHSAGSQFTHRYALFQPLIPGANCVMSVAANAGSYTVATYDAEFPYGLLGSSLTNSHLRVVFAYPLVVLLGTLDTDPNAKDLSHSAGSEAQGASRWDRGHNFFAKAKTQAAVLGATFNWKMYYAPGVAHSNYDITPYAVKALFHPDSPELLKPSGAAATGLLSLVCSVLAVVALL